MAFDFPNAPSTGTLYQPAGGPTYRWSGSVWSVVAAQFQGAMPSDTAPANHVPGQLWWESDTGSLFVWYDDGNSQQWVQISGPQPMPPNDGNEYTMVNGVWRLSRQSFDLAGKTSQDIPVPDWGPSEARLTCYYYNGATMSGSGLRVSVDGTTFPAGAADYNYAGFIHYTGSLAFQNTAATATTNWYFTPGTDNVTVPATADAVVNLNRNSASNAAYRLRCCAYSSGATALFQEVFMEGYTAGAASFPGTGPLKALRWFTTGAAPVSGKLTVEWLP